MEYSFLYSECAKYYPNYRVSENGAQIAYSGEKTGRSPKDKRIVYDDNTHNIDWGTVNIPMSKDLYFFYKEKVINYIDNKKKDNRVYIIDGYAGWKNSKLIRVICVNPYHAIFMKNMLIDPKYIKTNENRSPDFIIYAAGEIKLSNVNKPLINHQIDIKNPLKDTLIGFNFTDKSMIILGTEYAGEIKKAVFSYMLFEMPKLNLLPLHSSANVNIDNNCTTLFLGLSGTGKTTLSTDDYSNLVGDDEHIWCDEGIYNIEGGCYAKCAYLDQNKEPQIFNSIKYGAILENVILNNNVIDYNDLTITENTRCSYPLNFINNCVIPAIANHPNNIIFLTCDATGLLPLVSELEDENIIFMFLAGYTSKMAGTEIGINKPEPVFSSCFAGPFIVWEPILYGQMLKEKIKKYGARVWLVNTGYNAKGDRYPLNISRQIINDIKTGIIDTYCINKLEHFNLKYFSRDPNDTLFNPKLNWDSEDTYLYHLNELYNKFQNLNK